MSKNRRRRKGNSDTVEDYGCRKKIIRDQEIISYISGNNAGRLKKIKKKRGQRGW